MPNKRYRYIILVISFILGLAVGKFYQQYRFNHSVAIRISSPEHEIDYDLKQAINFLSYQFEKEGFYIAGISDANDLYPARLDKAKINLFVRGFTPFYDVRAPKDRINIFYVERTDKQYNEEYTGYDAYWTNQHIIKEKLSPKLKVHYFQSGAKPRPLLTANDEYDVLYISEAYNPYYTQFLRAKYPNSKIYGSTDFGNLPLTDQQHELSKAKLVVYEMLPNSADDKDFVPFAVYDIIAYGRPCLTNFKAPLAQQFDNNVFMFRNDAELEKQTEHLLTMPDKVREQKAQTARKSLKDKKIQFIKNLT